MKKIIITSLFLVLLISTITADPIKVYFHDLSDKDDFQGHRLCKEIILLLSLSKDFKVVHDRFMDSIFVLEIVTLDPTYEGKQTCASIRTYYQRVGGDPGLHVVNSLVKYDKAEIEQRAEAIVNLIKAEIDMFKEYYPEYLN